MMEACFTRDVSFCRLHREMRCCTHFVLRRAVGQGGWKGGKRRGRASGQRDVFLRCSYVSSTLVQDDKCGVSKIVKLITITSIPHF